MADQKLTDLTELTAPAGEDITYAVDDPSGSKLSRKMQISKLLRIYVPRVVQCKVSTTQASSIVLDKTPTNGNTILLLSNSTTGQISNVTETNVAWTQLVTQTGAAAYSSLWSGIVSASASATINVTKPGTYNTMIAIEIEKTLTSTLVSHAHANVTGLGWTDIAFDGTTAGNVVVICSTVDNTTVGVRLHLSNPCGGIFESFGNAMVVAISDGGLLYASKWAGGDNSYICAEIS